MARALRDTTLRQEMITRGLSQADKFTWQRAARQLSTAFDRTKKPGFFRKNWFLSTYKERR
jgi:hypothetical protein